MGKTVLKAVYWSMVALGVDLVGIESIIIWNGPVSKVKMRNSTSSMIRRSMIQFNQWKGTTQGQLSKQMPKKYKFTLDCHM